MVCPKCREHAQVLEQSAQKTTRCQHCGALLRVRKLRVFFASDELSEAITARTRLQAKFSGQASAEFFEKLIKEPKTPVFTSKKLEKPIHLQVEKAKKSASPKKSPQEILFELLEASGGKKELKALEEAALERGLSLEMFEKVLQGLLATGELYSPSKGFIKRV
ncbi:MAG: hypothetical protein PHD41_08010 [Methanosarcinaceae archaeon]|nr:hypothetical protein [Methanosarcinaceae archaeon]